MLDLMQLSQQQRAFLNEAAQAYHSQITSRVASYLTGRGIGQAEANSYLLGECVEPLPSHERFVGMLSIPYLSPAGVLGFKFRCPEDHKCKDFSHPKYDSPAGQRARLYNVAALHTKGDTVALVEGELSALICTVKVGVPTVGTPGTQWVKEHPHWGRVFADFDRVLVIADHDLDANGKQDQGKGIGHAKRVVSTLPNAQLITPPPGLDVDEWIARDGADVVRKAVLGEE